MGAATFLIRRGAPPAFFGEFTVQLWIGGVRVGPVIRTGTMRGNHCLVLSLLSAYAGCRRVCRGFRRLANPFASHFLGFLPKHTIPPVWTHTMLAGTSSPRTAYPRGLLLFAFVGPTSTLISEWHWLNT